MLSTGNGSVSIVASGAWPGAGGVGIGVWGRASGCWSREEQKRQRTEVERSVCRETRGEDF